MEDLTARAGAPLAIFGLSAYDFIGPGTQHIFYQGFGDAAGDGHIHELLWDGQKWHHNDLTAETGAPLATNYPSSYIFFAEGTQHVNYQEPRRQRPYPRTLVE